MRLLLTALCAASVLAAAPPDLRADEAQLKDVIQGVVGRYLGDSNESKVLSSALMKAFEDEGLGDDSDNYKVSGAPRTVSLEKRDIRADALPPPELFLDLLGEDLDSSRKPTLHMEIATNVKRNCTKRKRRKKKSKLEPVRLPVAETSPRPDLQENTDFSSFGVPPTHVEIPRLSTSDKQFFHDDPPQRPAASSRGDSSHARSSDSKQRNHDKLPAFSEQAPTSYQVSSSYFSLGSTVKPGTRRNPFERFEHATSSPYREEVPVSREALVPKRGKSREPRTTTPNPLSGSASLDDGSPDPLATSEPNKPSRIPKVRLTTLEPPTDPHRPEVAQYSFLPQSTTTYRPVSSSRGPDGSYRTLIPSSLNKGTLQHFSLFPKQPQSNSFSKIILAVGGARYAPLSMSLTSDLLAKIHSNSSARMHPAADSKSAAGPDSTDRTASPTGFYSTIVSKQTSSLASADESGVIQTPTSRFSPEYAEGPLGAPGSLLPMSPKVVSGQVLVFSSQNRPDDTEIYQSVQKESRPDEGKKSDRDGAIEITTSSPQQTTDCVTHAATATVRPEFGARMAPPPSIPRRAEVHAADGPTPAEPRETLTGQGFMPDAPTILMQVPLPDHPEFSNHGYVKGNAQLHIPLVYKLQKKKDKTAIRGELAKERTLISLPNNPFARLNPVNKAYYKYRESDLKSYLPKAFIKLERVQNVQVNAQAPHRSMVVFE
ncbi:uncharacterized protein LOC114828106 [Galendromus occidentalis]|uniref:Uncharacterized protein LOC114828106 n=1 Tax=Galendromus occidentalis TaxID=34638 RepID=A0AAJ7SDR5_9ACAR|nr:uncharacterized protein LOC114828106 [Galendromus occidentalis]